MQGWECQTMLTDRGRRGFGHSRVRLRRAAFHQESDGPSQLWECVLAAWFGFISQTWSVLHFPSLVLERPCSFSLLFSKLLPVVVSMVSSCERQFSLLYLCSYFFPVCFCLYMFVASSSLATPVSLVIDSFFHPIIFFPNFSGFIPLRFQCDCHKYMLAIFF